MTDLLIVSGMTFEDQKRLDDLFNQVYCKSENNNLKFNEFLIFLLDRELITAKYNFEFYYNLYQEYFKLEEIVPKIDKMPNKKQGKEQQQIYQIKDDVPKFSRTKFLRLIDGLGKQMFKGQKKYLDSILKLIFLDKKQQSIIRELILDEPNKKLLNETVIKIIINYQQDIQALFTMYQPENYYKQDIMLTWKEVSLMNLRMPISQFIVLVTDMELHPIHYNYENIEDICMRIIPALYPKENQFYQTNQIKQISESIISQKFKYSSINGDPKISYLEFQFLICKMGSEIINRELQQDSKKDIAPLINKFFEKVILLKQNGQKDHSDKLKHLQLIQKFYESFSLQETEHIDIQEKHSDVQDLQQQNYQFFSKKPEQLDIKEIWQFFQQDLPPLPQLKNQQNLTQDFVNSLKEKERREELARKLEEAKANKNKPPAPKPQAKKGEQPMKYQWEPLIQPPRICSYQYFIDFVKKTKETNKFRDINDLNTLSHITPAPVMLPECLYPHNPPQNVIIFIEAALMAFAQQNYFQSMQNLNAAQELWSNQIELHDQQLVFFEYFGGQIYEIAGQDEAALNKFLKVKFHTDKLSSDHPDRALPYCGLGSVLYHMEEYELSARAFMKARILRENSIGDENIENAIIFNNLGCALHQNGDLFAAENCYQFAIALLDLHLGLMNGMTMTAKSNLQKLKKSKCFRQ